MALLLLCGCSSQQPPFFNQGTPGVNTDSDFCANTPIPLLPMPEHGLVHIEIEKYLYHSYQIWLDKQCDILEN